MTRLTESLIIKGTPKELYRKWLQIENYPRFLKNVKSAKVIDNEVSHWVLQGPSGKNYDLDIEITKDDPDQRIGWRTTKGELMIHGQVAFAPLPDDQTEVSVILNIEPGENQSDQILNALGDPHEQLYHLMNNFKQYVEGMPERLPGRD